jgi:hypothetical protein
VKGAAADGRTTVVSVMVFYSDQQSGGFVTAINRWAMSCRCYKYHCQCGAVINILTTSKFIEQSSTRIITMSPLEIL